MGIVSNLFSGVMSLLSGGAGEIKVSEQLLFDKVIGFKGVCDGAGASTVLQNVAVMLSDTTRYKVCVVDTNMLYPCQASLLGCSDIKEDVFDFDRGASIGKILWESNWNGVSVVGFNNRTVVDMVGVLESARVFDKLLDELKTFFDIILIDLSHEPTNFAVQAAIKCNKIFLVSDTSMKNTSNIVRSVNYLATLGVSLAKCKRVIINKTTSVNSGITNILGELGLEVFDSIPFSHLIYTQGIAGKPFYGLATRDSDITQAHIVIQRLVNDIIEKTPRNSKYSDGTPKVQKQEESVSIDFGDSDDVSTVSNAVPASYPSVGGVLSDDFEPTFSDEGV